MPSRNFDYTQFLKRQNALYLLKYQNDPIEVAENPAPITGYSGHVPCYRSSLHQQRMVRSLVRCLTSPTKPTTATGYKSATNRLPVLDRPKTAISQDNQPQKDTKNSKDIDKRAQSAPPVTRLGKSVRESSESPSMPVEKLREEVKSREVNSRMEGRPVPSRISMMSAGSADSIQREMARSPSISPPSRPQTRRRVQSRPDSSASSISNRPITRQEVSKRPTGYSQTLYGASYWYAWPETAQQVQRAIRQESFDEDRRLTRYDDVIYHKHEGIVPKYMGYVPGYKFRHGSTFGVLTSHATDLGVVHKREVKMQ